jgi:uncharacterized protein (TIGR03435 family)
MARANWSTGAIARDDIGVACARLRTRKGGSMWKRCERLAVQRRFASARIGLVLFAIGTATSLVAGQAASPQFEVVSVKVNTAGENAQTLFGFPSGRFAAINLTLLEIIRGSHGREFTGRNRIEGGPAWVSSTRFDIEGRWAGNPSTEERWSMVRAMLADRFGLVTHIEAREMSVYALSAAKPGARRPGLRASKASCPTTSGPPSPPPPGTKPSNCGVALGPDGLSGDGASMWQLASVLGNLPSVGRTVVDRTGLSGLYDFTVEYTRAAPPSPTGDGTSPLSDGPSIFTALEEQLGLTLEATRAPVDLLIIDRAALPRPN